MSVALILCSAIALLGNDCGGGTDSGGATGAGAATATGTLSVTAGIPASLNQACAPTGTGAIQITVTPTRLEGSEGANTTAGDTVFMPEVAEAVGQDTSGSPIYRCQANKAFMNLWPGTWRIKVAGAAGPATCVAVVQPRREVEVGAGGGGCTPDDGAILTVIAANFANATDSRGADWQTRVDRFVSETAVVGLVPDVISITETSGWWQNNTGTAAGDYDVYDRLISDLRRSTGIGYRVAYMVGNEGTRRDGAGTPTAWYFSGDALLYNPSRIENLNVTELAALPQVPHADQHAGPAIRRSLPLCNRTTTLEPLEDLIDGLVQVDKCARHTPGGPAWALNVQSGNGDWHVAASLARLGLITQPNGSFDVFTVHPSYGEGTVQGPLVEGFIKQMTSPPNRTAAPRYPMLVLGDVNELSEQEPWPSDTTRVYKVPNDHVLVATGPGSGETPAHGLSPIFATQLPTVPQLPFSDHSGVLATFAESGP